MYKKELVSLLQSKKVPPYFMLYGADEYQIELFGREILSFYVKGDANLLSLYFDEYDFARAKAHLGESSLFGGINVLHLKLNKKIPAKELKSLIELTSQNEACFLLEFYEADARAAMDMQKAFGANFARFFKPNNPREAIDLLSGAARKLGLNITQNALYQIYSIHNENLYLAASELNKLAALNQHIDEAMVRQLVFGLSEISFDDFFDKFITLKPISKQLDELLNGAGFNEIAFINALYNSFLRLFKLFASVKSTGILDLKQALGYTPPPAVANALKQQSMSLNLRQYQAIFMCLNEAELELKSGLGIGKSELIISLVLNLQGIISSKT